MVCAAALLGYSILLANIQQAGPQMGWWPEHISVSEGCGVSCLPSTWSLRDSATAETRGTCTSRCVVCCLQVIQKRNLLPPLERVRRLKATDAADAPEGALWGSGPTPRVPVPVVGLSWC